MTNATKAAVISALNVCLGTSVLFGAPLSEAQIGGLTAAVNALLGVWIAVTYKNSAKRVEDS